MPSFYADHFLSAVFNNDLSRLPRPAHFPRFGHRSRCLRGNLRQLRGRRFFDLEMDGPLSIVGTAGIWHAFLPRISRIRVPGR